MKNLPKARTENLVEQEIGKEVMLYDLLLDKAFNLNETLTIIYKACNGVTAFEDLKKRHKFTDDFIFLALDELKRENLLIGNYQSPFAATNRRQVIKKVGLATMFALPIITGLIAPTALHAASGANAPPRGVTLGGPCNANGTCFADGNGGQLTCVEGKCCRNYFGTIGSRLAGESFTIKTCERAATVPCQQTEAARMCCSNEVSGTCTMPGYVEGQPPVDEDGNWVLCYFEDGSATYDGYPGTCNCTCL